MNPIISTSPERTEAASFHENRVTIHRPFKERLFHFSNGKRLRVDLRIFYQNKCSCQELGLVPLGVVKVAFIFVANVF